MFGPESSPLAVAVDLFVGAMYVAIIGRILMSYVSTPFPDTPLKQLLWSLTEPLLAPLRRVLPTVGMFDLSPMAALFLLGLLRRVMLQLLGGY
jgi:YggT family protein